MMQDFYCNKHLDARVRVRVGFACVVVLFQASVMVLMFEALLPACSRGVKQFWMEAQALEHLQPGHRNAWAWSSA
jgi:hypothetical protein